MRVLIAGLVTIVLASGAAAAQGSPAITPEMTAMETKLLAKVGPETHTWIKQEAARQRTGSGEAGKLDAESWKTYPSLGGLADADIMALAFLVMMEAAKSAQEDLKSVMAGVKSINAQKAQLRETQRAKSSLAETQSLRLQTQMDRRAKMLETASNLMKKMAESGSTTVRNLK